MKKLIIASLILSSSISFAAIFGGSPGYELKLALTINGKTVANPIVRLKPGLQASVTEKNAQGETFIDVIATDDGGQIRDNKAISMKFVVGTIKNGERIILAEPKIITLEKEKAEVTFGKSKDQDTVSLSVIPERVVL